MFFRKLQKLHQKLMLFYEVLEEAVMKVVTKYLAKSIQFYCIYYLFKAGVTLKEKL